jgi:hypothetical protein
MAFTTGQAGGQTQQLADIPAAYATDAQELARAQRLAKMLSSQQPAEGQMVSGRYVAPSWTQHLAQLVNAGMGAYYADKAETQQQALANKIREGEAASMADYMKTKLGTPASQQQTELAGPYGQAGEAGANVPQPMATRDIPATPANPQAANANMYFDPRSSTRMRDMAFAKMYADPEEITLSEGQKRLVRMPDGSLKEVASGGEKLHSVNGNLVDSKGNVVFKAPKEYAPHAPQMVQTDQGMMMFDPNNRTFTPAMANGQPIMPPMDAGAKTDLRDNQKQQKAIAGGIEAVTNTPSAFSYKRGASGTILGESISNRLENKDETEARSYVFNIVSKVIHDRAGASQTPSEIAKINRFLPNEFDNADAIKRKLTGFQKFLKDEAEGIRQPVTSQAGGIKPPATPPTVANAGEGKGHWEYRTFEGRQQRKWVAE